MSQPTIERTSSKLAHSAGKLEGSTERIEDSADRRTELAADRTILAAERTYGAWVRTGLLALASGLGAKAGLAGVVPEWMIVANGSVLVWSLGLLSLIVVCCAIPAMIVGLTGTLRVALALVAVLNVTAVSFTGFTYPLFSMSTTAKVWSSITPFHYFYEIQEQQWNSGAPPAMSAAPFAVLWTVYIAVPLAIAMPLLAKRCRDPEGWGER